MSDSPMPDLHGPKGKRALIVAGTAGGAYVVWAWYRSRKAAAAAATAAAAPTDQGYVTQATPGAAGDYAGTTASAGGATSGSTAPLDNASWAQLAVQLLQGAGYDAATVAACLGKYLGRQPLTDAEAMVVRAALAMAGPPPVGTYVIIPVVGSPPPSTTPTPTPTPVPPPAMNGGNPPAQPAPHHRYPEWRLDHTNVKGDNYTSIAQKYGTGLSGVELYNYQFTPQAGRSAKALADIRSRGPNLIERGGTTAVPYPK